MKTRVGIVHRNVPIQARILGVSAVTIESFHPLKHCLAKIYYTKLILVSFYTTKFVDNGPYSPL